MSSSYFKKEAFVGQEKKNKKERRDKVF